MRKRTYIQRGYPPEFNDEFKREVRTRDKYRCAICNRRRRLDIHHIDYKKRNTTKFNCISLCRDCHKAIHRSSWVEKQNWTYKLWCITADRENKNGSKSTSGS